MNDSQLARIKKAFENYRQNIFASQNDIQFWRSFLTISIDNYVKDKPKEFRMYEAIFAVYDINPLTNIGYLNSHQLTTAYSTNTIHKQKDDFFNWIINMAVLKTYNATEIFLLETISIKYFENMEWNVVDKKTQTLVNTEIKNYLKREGLDGTTTNNKHLIKYLKNISNDFGLFSSQLTRVDSQTTWQNFFNMFSILRNIIAHNGMIVNKDTLNEIRSSSNDVFNSFFKLSSSNTLSPIQDQFLNFLGVVNDFTINSSKIILEEKDLLFLNLG